MKKILLMSVFLLTLGSLLVLTFNPVLAKKKIIRRSTATTTTGTGGSRLIISPKLRNDRKALVVNFSNMGVVSSFFYELSYQGSGMPQGVAGTVNPNGQTSIQRELLFGTCSKNVCRYHTGIQNMKFVVTSTLLTGQRVRRTFSIKV